MKKLVLGIIICLLTLTGCDNNLMNTPTKRVEALLNNYITLDKKVLDDLDETLLSETIMTPSQKDEYREIIKKQYQNMSYKIKDETINGDNANVVVEIEVYNYKKIIDDANNYLTNNQSDFFDETGGVNPEKFNNYKLQELKKSKDKITYTLNLTLNKQDNKWILNDLTDTDIKKIHGMSD